MHPAMSDPSFDAVLSWPCPPRRVFYPSASACAVAQSGGSRWSRCCSETDASVAVSCVIAVDDDTKVQIVCVPDGGFFAGCGHVEIERDPWRSGRGWYGVRP
jgi:hypothetical protein